MMSARLPPTRINNIVWDHGKAPDGTHPSELVVRATLDVYKFAPDKTCGEGAGRPRHDTPGAADPVTPPP